MRPRFLNLRCQGASDSRVIALQGESEQMTRKCLLVLLLWLGSTAAMAAGVLRVGVSADYPPLVFERDGQIVGIEADNALAVGEIIGRKVSLSNMSFDKLIPALLAEGYLREPPADPLNDNTYQYRYRVYNKGANGCVPWRSSTTGCIRMMMWRPSISGNTLRS